MKNTNLVKLGLLTLVSAQVLSTATFAATTGTIQITGTVGESNSLVVADEAGDLALGDAISNTKVGAITVASNSTGGFKVSFTSTNGFKLTHPVSGATPQGQLAYTLALTNATGTLGTNVTAPTLTGITGAANTAVDLDFDSAGNNATPTSITYDVALSASAKALIQTSGAQKYSDTITVDLAAL